MKKYKRKRSSRYFFLKNYLDGKGYSVYPTEIAVATFQCPEPEKYFMVDVAAWKKDAYYAFEYKSSGDHLYPRGLNQLLNYSASFDFVILVAEVPRHRFGISLNPERGKRIREILASGAGLWTVKFREKVDDQITFTEVMAPKRQNPNPKNKQWIIDKFQRYVWGFPPFDEQQKRLGNYVK